MAESGTVSGKKKEERRNDPPRGIARRAGKATGIRYGFEIRRKAVQLVTEEGISSELVAREIGACASSVENWTKRYRAEGEAGLRDRKYTSKKKTGLPKLVVDKIVEIKKADPTKGTRTISQLLRRMFFMKASPSAVGKHTKANGLITPKKKKRRVQKLEDRRFEYSKPNAFWQSDITVFTILDKPAYIIGFIDDYSRYVTGLGMYRSQTSESVLEVYRRATGQHGVPSELLTDNGRQYASWRGKTKFQKELAKAHVHHIRSQPHHPQTLGKIERFWQTLKDDFLSRSKFETFDEAQERLAYWVKHYNHQRPHQSIEGLCPADRFFKIKEQMKATIEKNMAANMEELALHGKPIEPFYMVGQVGDRSVVIESDKKRFSVTVNGSEVQGTSVTREGRGTDESGSGRIGGGAETEASAAVRGEGKEPGSTESMERKTECGGPDEGVAGALGSSARLGTACNTRDTDSAGSRLEADKGNRVESALAGGEVDRTDPSQAAGTGSPDELRGDDHAEHGTGSVRGAGEMPGGAGDMDGAEEGLGAVQGAVDQLEPAVAVAGSCAIGYVGSPGAERTGRQGGPCACPADKASAGSQDQGTGAGERGESPAQAPHVYHAVSSESHGSLTREVIALGSGRESGTVAESHPGSSGRQAERDGSCRPDGSEPEDLLREAGACSCSDAAGPAGPADWSAGKSSGSGEGRAAGGAGSVEESPGGTGRQDEGTERIASGDYGSRSAVTCR